MSHNPRWVRLSRGGEGKRGRVVHRWCRVSPVADIPCYPKRRAVIPQDLRVATRGRREAARGCKTTRALGGREEGAEGCPWINRRRGH